jgi:hypothetical protein
MTEPTQPVYFVLLLQSVSHVMKAEKILMAENIPVKIIPVPKAISSDCGVCIRLEENSVHKIKTVLEGEFESMEIRQL